MPSLRVDRTRTQRDDAEEAACDVGRVGAVGWFGQRVSRNRASSSPSTTAWPKNSRYGFSRTPQSSKVRRRFHRLATSKLGSQLRGPGRDLAMTKPRKATGQRHEIASRYAPPASTKCLGPEKGLLRSAPDAARLGGEKHDNTSPGKRKRPKNKLRTRT